MTTLLSAVHAIAGLIILAEAHRRLEHARPAESGLTWGQRALQALCVVAWLLLAFAAVCAVVAPVLVIVGPPICWRGISLDMTGPPSISEVLVLAGFAGLVVRDWLERP